MEIHTRLVISLFLAASVYLAGVLVLGEQGVLAYRQLHSYKENLEENVNALQDIGSELSVVSRSLRTDAGRIGTLARSLGYFEDNERLIRVEGFSLHEAPYSMGRMLNKIEAEGGMRPLVRTAAFMVGILYFAVAGLLWGGRSRFL